MTTGIEPPGQQAEVFMNSDNFNRLADVLVEDFEIERDEISASARLYDDLGLDSIDAVDLVVRMREITGKKVPPEQFKSVQTVGDVLEILKTL